jgi:hypothetical protein
VAFRTGITRQSIQLIQSDTREAIAIEQQVAGWLSRLRVSCPPLRKALTA